MRLRNERGRTRVGARCAGDARADKRATARASEPEYALVDRGARTSLKYLLNAPSSSSDDAKTSFSFLPSAFAWYHADSIGVNCLRVRGRRSDATAPGIARQMTTDVLASWAS